MTKTDLEWLDELEERTKNCGEWSAVDKKTQLYLIQLARKGAEHGDGTAVPSGDTGGEVRRPGRDSGAVDWIDLDDPGHRLGEGPEVTNDRKVLDPMSPSRKAV